MNEKIISMLRRAAVAQPPVATSIAAAPHKLEARLAAVQKDGYAIQYLTEARRTPDVCMAAVQQDGYAIQYLTEAQRTPELCLAAVQQDGYAIQYLTARDVSQPGEAGDHLREVILSLWEDAQSALPSAKRQELAAALLKFVNVTQPVRERG